MALLMSDATAGIQAKGYGSDSESAQFVAVQAELRRIYGLRRWKWLDATGTLTTTVDNDLVATTSLTDLRAIDAVRVSYGTTEYDDLEWMPTQQLRDLSHAERESATPRYWTQLGSAIRLHPRPERVYTLTVDYGKLPALPTVAGSTMVLPDQYLDVVVWAGVRDLAFRQRDWTGQAAAKTLHDEVLTEMIREDSLEQRQSPTTVQHSSFWDNY